MMIKTPWPKQAGVLLPGILCAILIWHAGVGEAKAACNAGNILYTTLTIELSKDVVCVGGTVTATVTTDPIGANVTLTSIPSIPPKISISPTVGLPGVFTITGVTESDLPGDVPLLATIVSGVETDPEVVSCIKSIPNALTVLKVDVSIDLVDEEPVPDPRATVRDASGLDMSTLSVTLNGYAVATSLMTISDITSGSVVVGKKLQSTAPCSMLNLPGSNEVKANISDNAGNAMDEVTQTFTLP